MSSLNKVILLGNVGSVDIKAFENGGKIVNVSLATSERQKKGEEYVDKTEWHKCVFVYNSIVERASSISKGDKIYIEGSLSTNSWVTKEGDKRESKEIICSTLKIFSKKKEDDSFPQDSAPQASQVKNESLEDLF